jgi:Mg-chelatase subunit ChlD
MGGHQSSSGGHQGSSGNQGSSMNGQVECYDCHQFVTDLKAHRAVCPLSRRTKSIIGSAYNEGQQGQKSNGGSQKKNRLENNQETVDFYLTIDVSGSMAGGRLEAAKNSARRIIEIMKPNDRMSIVTFDSKAFFKLKPRPVEQILRQKEIEPLLDRIFAQGSTALYDACHLIIDQRRDSSRKTIVVVITDGEDNSSTHSFDQTLTLIKNTPNLAVCIVNIGNSFAEKYRALAVNGSYTECNDSGILTTVLETFSKIYQVENA